MKPLKLKPGTAPTKKRAGPRWLRGGEKKKTPTKEPATKTDHTKPTTKTDYCYYYNQHSQNIITIVIYKIIIIVINKKEK